MQVRFLRYRYDLLYFLRLHYYRTTFFTVDKTMVHYSFHNLLHRQQMLIFQLLLISQFAEVDNPKIVLHFHSQFLILLTLDLCDKVLHRSLQSPNCCWSVRKLQVEILVEFHLAMVVRLKECVWFRVLIILL